jgi:methylenetetrahydrofolate dehydrogenase (NADP+)/methenyltetrahydrofolate cyclohydrolase
MTARLLDGQALARSMQEEIRPEVAAFTAKHGRAPGLGIVLVGDDPASEVYVRNKLKAGADIGFRADLERLPSTATLADTLVLVDRLNRSAVHDGILVQSPLPKAMGADAEQHVFDSIAPEKDVDGLTPVNVGRLVQKRAMLVACTPSGIIEMLERERIGMAGRHAVVIGRSEIVGKPMALLLLHRDATVTICHSRTPDLADVCRQADILVAAAGRAGLVTKAFVKAGGDGHRCGDEQGDRRGGCGDAVPRRTPSAPGLPLERIGPCRRRPSRCRRSRGRIDTCSRRRRSTDNHDADEEHVASREDATRLNRLSNHCFWPTHCWPRGGPSRSFETL